MFNRRRRNNRGAIWASLLGLGVSAAAVVLRRNGNKNMPARIQNLTNTVRFPNNLQMKNMANAIAEFSKELAPYKKRSKDEQ